MNIYFLNHSGFMLDDGIRCYIFDYYKDPAGRVAQMAAAHRELWFFVTHVHADHYNPAIAEFDGPTTLYIAHKDVPLRGVKNLTVMDKGDTVALDSCAITMYGSTDEGGSFLLKTPRDSSIHSGDLNSWHWLGDTLENIQEAKDFAWTEMAPLEGITVDYGMFPVDNRLEDAMEWGVIEFLRRMTVRKALLPMHLNGPQWKPSLYFKALYPDVTILNPAKEGEAFENV